jgi:hypothetical protein
MGDLGYGTDLVGASDLTASMDEITDPNSPQAIAEAVARRFDCPEGGLIDDPTYGHDIRQYLNTGTTDVELNAMASQMRVQTQLDDRVESARVKVTPGGVPLGSELTATIRITPVDPATGEFTMTLTVTDAAIALEVAA